jgi:hypothetical protein
MGMLKLGMKQGLQGQTKAQRQDEFKNNSRLLSPSSSNALYSYQDPIICCWVLLHLLQHPLRFIVTTLILGVKIDQPSYA